MRLRVSLIVTVKNESQALVRLLDSMAAQSRAPEEIIIVDGGSTDGTLDLLRANEIRLPLKNISMPGANISQGRNAAIRAATGDIICSTDAGVWLDGNWVKELVEPFDRRPSTADSEMGFAVGSQPSAVVDVVSGFFLPDPQGAFETALAATTLPALADIHPEKFQPSSRSVAFRKAAWEHVGGYPEWLDYCEDLVFDSALRAVGLGFAFAPRAIAHFRPRANLRAFFKQYYRYARGDGKANLFFKRHLIRYAIYLMVLPGLIGSTFVASQYTLPLWLIAAAFMFFTPYKRMLPLLAPLSFADRLRALAWIPVIRVTGDVGKMLGYPVGVVWRANNRKG